MAAAVCPHPPLLVPQLAAGAAPELDELRAHCRSAVEAVAAATPDALFVVGAETGAAATSLAPWGIDVAVDVPEPLPLSLLIGAWLTAGMARSFVVVADDLDADDCADLGRELAASAERVALVVMGDGSARHNEKAPGYLDARAAAFDDVVARAFGQGDAATLLALDLDLSGDLMVAGRAPWQVLAGAVTGRVAPRVDDSFFTAPYGVGYHVATWAWPASQ